MKLYLMLMFLAVFMITDTGAQAVSIGNFKNANSFYINPAGFIYVTDLNENKIYKLDTLGNQLRETGGYGWDESAFDSPSDIFATSLNVYVADKNNHRVQWFDKDLNFISLLQTRNNRNEEIRFGYPLSAAVSGQGDLYILDQENNRILKFDLFGNFIMEFGGLDAGRFRINRPLEFALLNNTTYLLDSKGRRIVVFDQFGNGLNIIKLNQKIDNISASEGNILLNNKSEVYQLDIASGETINIGLPEDMDDELRDVFTFRNDLYILTPSRIIILRE
jgi:DNA-binding beta-propeller fold protein YncE